MLFKDRSDAGKQLAAALLEYANQKNAIVIGLPRGGVVVAAEVAAKLNLPLDVICPRKVGAPFNPELALGAVTETGAGFFNEDLIKELQIPQNYLKVEIEKQKNIAEQRLLMYRKELPPLNLNGKIVLLVDDGLATGATMKAAIQFVKMQNAKKIIVAVPVSPQERLQEMKKLVDEVVFLSAPYLFQAVGQFYEDFNQTSDEEVVDLLRSLHGNHSA